VNKALSKAQEESQEKMNAAAGGMVSGIKIPGM
jgi:DNA-binding protein YbaB